MPQIELRRRAGTRSPEDLVLSVQERTFEFLRVTHTPEIRISAFFEQDYARVESKYEEVFVGDDSAFVSTVQQIIPGSRTRQGISLPGPMHTGEQLTILVKRSSR